VKKILLLPGAQGGMLDWKVVGTMADKAKTKLESDVYSMKIGPVLSVGSPTISPTSKTDLPTLSWQNNCGAKFKVWFGGDAGFTKKEGLFLQS